VSDIFEQPDEAATPLREEERHALKLTYITNREQLNAAEQENIARGQEWALSRRRNFLTESGIRSLHHHMFEDVWRWAGQFRKHDVNIGIEYWKIPVELRVLLDDAKTWIEAKAYPPDEIAVRLHHRLTQIHPFPNGNGRHARLMADLIVMQLGGKRFSWGGAGGLQKAGDVRCRYIAALKAADDYDLGPLLAFARS
jgi:Fic-DOC domain mobile mystery protein B